jgi:P-type Cu+ transporter
MAEKIVLDIEGMDCTSCANSISKKLLEKGAQDVDVSFTTGQAVFFVEVQQQTEQLINEVEKLGYRVKGSEKHGNEKWFETLEGRLIISSLFTFPLLLHMFVHNELLNNAWFQLFMCLPVYLIGVQRFGISAWASLRNKTPNMDVLIITGSSAAFIYSVLQMYLQPVGAHLHEFIYFETTATIITLVLLGNYLEHRTVKQTTSALKDLTELQPQNAKRLSLQFGQQVVDVVSIKELNKFDIVAVDAGEKIPADGIVISGEAWVNESMITGESLPAEKKKDDKLLAGTIVSDGNLIMQVQQLADDTLLSQIIELVKSAQRNKPELQKLGDRISNVFVPVVVGIALLTFIISMGIGMELKNALLNSIAVLVISCPCAMGLATPTAVMAGIGRATKAGIIIKGGSTLEAVSQVKTFVFDKTGTLTTGNFVMSSFRNFSDFSDDDILSLIAGIEKYSTHPVARSLSKFEQKSHRFYPTNIRELKGIGMQADLADGIVVKIGSGRILELQQNELSEQYDLFITFNDKLIAALSVEDELKPGAVELMAQLKKEGFRTVLLSGDKKSKCKKVAENVGVDEVFAEKLPAEKLEIIQQMKKYGKVAMVGDGVNDAPALAASDVGISVSEGSSAAINSAQVVLLKAQSLEVLNHTLRLSRATFSTIRQNLFFAFFYNVIAIPIAAVGLLNPMIAAFAMAMSDIVVIGNSIRLKYRRI